MIERNFGIVERISESNFRIVPGTHSEEMIIERKAINMESNATLNRCEKLLKSFKKAVENATDRVNRLYTAQDEGADDFTEIIMESVIQTHEIAIELAWKTVRCYALQIDPNSRVSGSTTAIKHGFQTGIIETDALARTLIAGIYYRNKSSHEYLLLSGMEEYIKKILTDFNPAINALLQMMEENEDVRAINRGY